MHYRCENPKKWQYKYYGALGIKVCDRWQFFANFVADMGERPEGMTLDRINNDGNYEPSNCQWATKLQQANNTRFNRILLVDGKRMTLSEAGRIWKVPFKTIWRRLELGWDESDAAKRTVRKHKPYGANERKV